MVRGHPSLSHCELQASEGQSHGKSPTSIFFFKLKGSRFCHHKILMLKTGPLYAGAELNLRNRVFGEVEKNSFIA